MSSLCCTPLSACGEANAVPPLQVCVLRQAGARFGLGRARPMNRSVPQSVGFAFYFESMTTPHNVHSDVLIMGELFTYEQRIEALAAFADSQLDSTYVADLADGSDDHENTLRRATAELADAGYEVDTARNTLRVASPVSLDAPRTETELAERVDREKAVKAVCKVAAIFGSAESITYDHTQPAMEAISKALAGTQAPSIFASSPVHTQYWEAIGD